MANFPEFSKASINLTITEEELRARPEYIEVEKLKSGIRKLHTPKEVENFCLENGFKFVNPEDFEAIRNNQFRAYSEKISDKSQKNHKLTKPN